jgi:hypothetical protein
VAVPGLPDRGRRRERGPVALRPVADGDFALGIVATAWAALTVAATYESSGTGRRLG